MLGRVSFILDRKNSARVCHVVSVGVLRYMVRNRYIISCRVVWWHLGMALYSLAHKVRECVRG